MITKYIVVEHNYVAENIFYHVDCGEFNSYESAMNFVELCCRMSEGRDVYYTIDKRYMLADDNGD
jgi:hypothetical protein